MHLTTVSYKDKFWWWFGARQLLLVVLYIIFAAIEGTHVQTLLLVFFCVVVVVTLVQAWIKPFKTTAINLLDISYLIYMAILLFIGLYYSVKRSTSPIWFLSSLFRFVPCTFCLTTVYHLLVVFSLHQFTDYVDVLWDCKHSGPITALIVWRHHNMQPMLIMLSMRSYRRITAAVSWENHC